MKGVSAEDYSSNKMLLEERENITYLRADRKGKGIPRTLRELLCHLPTFLLFGVQLLVSISI